MKQLLSGNEAIARGAYEADAKVAVGYPGTPSSEILENIVKYEGIKAQWAPNRWPWKWLREPPRRRQDHCHHETRRPERARTPCLP